MERMASNGGEMEEKTLLLDLDEEVSCVLCEDIGMKRKDYWASSVRCLRCPLHMALMDERPRRILRHGIKPH